MVESRVNLVIRIDEEFTNLIGKLQTIHFKLSKNGALVWTNPFNSSQILSVKPLVEGSTNYNVSFEGNTGNLEVILKRAFETFNYDVRQFHYHVYPEQYSMSSCRNKALELWNEINPRIFDCSKDSRIKDLFCLVMDDKITFHTRSIKKLDHVNYVMEQCAELSKVFTESVPYDLFTFEELLHKQIGGF